MIEIFLKKTNKIDFSKQTYNDLSGDDRLITDLKSGVFTGMTKFHTILYQIDEEFTSLEQVVFAAQRTGTKHGFRHSFSRGDIFKVDNYYYQLSSDCFYKFDDMNNQVEVIETKAYRKVIAWRNRNGNFVQRGEI
jgi:hypothetical protein